MAPRRSCARCATTASGSGCAPLLFGLPGWMDGWLDGWSSQRVGSDAVSLHQGSETSKARSSELLNRQPAWKASQLADSPRPTGCLVCSPSQSTTSALQIEIQRPMAVPSHPPEGRAVGTETGPGIGAQQGEPGTCNRNKPQNHAPGMAGGCGSAAQTGRVGLRLAAEGRPGSHLQEPAGGRVQGLPGLREASLLTLHPRHRRPSPDLQVDRPASPLVGTSTRQPGRCSSRCICLLVTMAACREPPWWQLLQSGPAPQAMLGLLCRGFGRWTASCARWHACILPLPGA